MQAGEAELRQWMIAGLDGDAQAHAHLLRILAELLRAYYRRRLGQGNDVVEDLVQETLIAVHKRRASYDRDRPFTAWFYAIARYKMIDHFRRAGRELPTEDIEAVADETDAQAASLARLDLERLLAELPEKQAMAIRATRIEGLSIAETAARADIGESDVKISIHRGLKALMKRIGGQ